MKVDVKQLEKQKDENFIDRLKFIDLHVKHIKETKNKVWSKEQKEFLDSE